MNPRGWGFPAWVYLFAMARWLDAQPNIPGRQKKRWASRIGFILPCLTCQVHYLYVFKTKYDSHKYNHNLFGWFRYVYFRVKRLQNEKQKSMTNRIKNQVKPWAVKSEPNVKRALMVFVYAIAFSYDAARDIQSQLPDPVAHYPLYVRMFLQTNFGLPSPFSLLHQHFTHLNHWTRESQILKHLDTFYQLSRQQRGELHQYLESPVRRRRRDRIMAAGEFWIRE